MGIPFLCPLQVYGFNRLPAPRPNTQSKANYTPTNIDVVGALRKLKKAVVVCSGSLQCCSGSTKEHINKDLIGAKKFNLAPTKCSETNRK